MIDKCSLVNSILLCLELGCFFSGVAGADRVSKKFEKLILAHALCATGNHGEAEALAEENLVLQNRVYGAAHPNAAAALELVGHVRAGLAAQAA